jgi:hypothetical protein
MKPAIVVTVAAAGVDVREYHVDAPSPDDALATAFLFEDARARSFAPRRAPRRRRLHGPPRLTPSRRRALRAAAH